MLAPPSDLPLVEYLEALHLVLVGVFGNILDTKFENGVRILKEEFVEALRTYNLRMTTKSACACPSGSKIREIFFVGANQGTHK